MAWWDVCNQGTTCLPWQPFGGAWGVNGARSDYGVPLPQGTQITAPVNGVVLPQHTGGGFYSAFGKQSFGGEVDILTWMPEYGGLADVGVIHMDTASVQPGRLVHKGDVIGTSGGQTSGGNWPSSPLFSSGPHVGVQIHRLGAWNQLLDPATLMQNLWRNKDSSSVPTPQQVQQGGFGNVNAALMDASSNSSGGQGCPWWQWFACHDPFNPARDIACKECDAAGGGNIGAAVGTVATGAFSALFPTLTTWLQDPLRALKLIAGGILVAIGLILAFLPDIGAAAVTAAGVPEAAPLIRNTLQANRGPGGLLRGGIRTAGAVQGQKTLEKREHAGFLKRQKLLDEQRSASAKKAAATRKANRAKNGPQESFTAGMTTEQRTEYKNEMRGEIQKIPAGMAQADRAFILRNSSNRIRARMGLPPIIS